MQAANKVWFPAKRYGLGWGLPVVWQGWVVYGLFVVALGAAARWIPRAQHPVLFVGFVIGWALALFAVCYLKGEKPHWRLGR